MIPLVGAFTPTTGLLTGGKVFEDDEGVNVVFAPVAPVVGLTTGLLVYVFVLLTAVVDEFLTTGLLELLAVVDDAIFFIYYTFFVDSI